jgi:hypothetical protein
MEVNWYHLIGQTVPNPSEFSVRAFEDVSYFTKANEGLSLAVKDDVVDYVILYSAHHRGVSQYAGPLPYGLVWSQRNSDIVRRLGEPEKKTAGGYAHIGIELTYTPLGLTLEFINNDWNDAENPLKTVVLFRPSVVLPLPFSMTADIRLCQVCRQPASLRCSRCRLFNYCSSACQRTDWPQHSQKCS